MSIFKLFLSVILTWIFFSSLLIGIIASVGTLFIRAQCPYTCILGKVGNTDLYLDVKRYKAVSAIFPTLFIQP